ncbi:hypothetical protein K461DRAFT_270034 [Myriangium duriaei CBS 260.36]|uniref:Uncharacterized protein n=1 Tax=Myriangium duriaei CBS 260.36 TaxID=1168546 RepID=A0A9P4MKA8_9PEZI|nr:hypothetical protein K461DRAFT_270034 [Myriangium duriaei CBS 260.36]
MGLPIFYDNPNNKPDKKTSDQPKPDPTAHARSSIRRRPSIHRGTFPRPPQRWAASRNNQGYWSPPPPPPLSPPPALPPAPEPADATNLNDPTSRRLMQMRMLRERQHQGHLHRQLRRQRALMDAASEHGRDDVMIRRYIADNQTGDNRRSILPTPPLEISSQRSVDAARSGNRTPNDTLVVPTITVQHATGLGDRVRSPSPMDPSFDIFEALARPHLDTPPAETPTLSSIRTTVDIPTEDVDSTTPDHLANPSDDPTTRDPDFECFSDSDTTSVSSAELIRGPRRWHRSDPNDDSGLVDIWDIHPSDQAQIEARRTHADNSDRTYSSFAPPPPNPNHEPYISRANRRRIPSYLREHSEIVRARESMREAGERLSRSMPYLDRDRRARAAGAHAAAARWWNDDFPERTSSATPGSGGVVGELDLDLDLEQMRGILERLSRRQDIPDEWWMSAGLSRDVVRSGGEAGAV